MLRNVNGQLVDISGDFAIGEDIDPIFSGDYAIGADGQPMWIGEDTDYIGADDYDFGSDVSIGRDPRRAMSLARLRAAALARQAGGFVVNQKPTLRRPYDLPLPFSVSVPANTTANVTLFPQRSIQVAQLVLGGEANFFLINSIQVGQESQFAAAGSMPGEVFSHLAAQHVSLKGSTANLGNSIVINVTNLDAANPHRFGGMIKGPTLIQAG